MGTLLRDRGDSVTGVDAATKLADLARATGAYRQVVEADAAQMPFADASFDVVVAFMSLTWRRAQVVLLAAHLLQVVVLVRRERRVHPMEGQLDVLRQQD